MKKKKIYPFAGALFADWSVKSTHGRRCDLIYMAKAEPVCAVATAAAAAAPPAGDFNAAAKKEKKTAAAGVGVGVGWATAEKNEKIK